jgi:hypothetical protein
MIDIIMYIQKPLIERKNHIDLNEPCIIRGPGYRHNVQLLLAHIFNTTLPEPKYRYKINGCHACNNGECSNPKHLYWGTTSENAKDRELTPKGIAAKKLCIEAAAKNRRIQDEFTHLPISRALKYHRRKIKNVKSERN